MASQIQSINDNIVNLIWEHVKSQPDPLTAFINITVNDNNIIQQLILLANLLEQVDIKETLSYTYFIELKEIGHNYPRMLHYIITHGGLGRGSVIFDYYNNFGKSFTFGEKRSDATQPGAITSFQSKIGTFKRKTKVKSFDNDIKYLLKKH